MSTAGPNRVDVTDREIFHDEFIEDYQRKDALLVPLMNNKGIKKADFMSWDILGNVDGSVERNRDGTIPERELDYGRVKAELKEQFSGRFGIDDFDAFRHNPNVRASQTKKSIQSCNLGRDKLILNTLNTATKVYNGGTAVQLDSFGKFLAMTNSLRIDEVPAGQGDLVFLCTPTTEALILSKVEEYKNGDYTTIGNVQKGAGTTERKMLAGTIIQQYTGLEGHATDDATCYLFHREAVCYGDDGDPITHVYYADDRDRHECWARFRQASTIGLPRGVMKVKVDDIAQMAALNV